MASNISVKFGESFIVGIDKQGFIVAREMTTHLTDDRSCVSSLITQAKAENDHDLIADGVYDSHVIYHCLKEQNIKPLIPPPKHAAIFQ